MNEAKVSKYNDKMYWESSVFRGLFAWALSFCLGSYLVKPLGHPEPYAHLTFGRWILANLKLPVEDLWTVLGAGEPWRDANWLFDALLAALYATLGEQTFIALPLCLNILAILLLLRLFGLGSFFGGLLTVLVSCGVLVDSSLSPELLSYGLFVICLLAAKEKRNFLFLISSICLANVHQSFFLLVFVTAFPAKWFILVVAAIANPYLGLHLLEFGLELSPGSLMSFPTVFLLLLWALALALLREGSVKPRELLGVLLLSLLSLLFSELTPYALILLGMVLSSLTLNKEAKLSGGLLILQSKLLGIDLFKGLVFLLFCFSVVNIYQLYRRPVLSPVFPSLEVDHILQAGGKVLHHPNIGAYLIYRSKKPLALYDERSTSDKALAVYKKKGLKGLSGGANFGLCGSLGSECSYFEKDNAWSPVELELGDVQEAAARWWKLYRRKE